LEIARHSLHLTGDAVVLTESAVGGLLMLGVGTGSKIATTYIPGIGVVVAPMMIVGEGGIAVFSWQGGYMSDAEFRRTMVRLGIQASGFTVGATIGGIIGFSGGPAGTFLGIAIGGAIGQGVVSLGILIYEWWRPQKPEVGLVGSMTPRERETYIEFVRQHYENRASE